MVEGSDSGGTSWNILPNVVDQGIDIPTSGDGAASEYPYGTIGTTGDFFSAPWDLSPCVILSSPDGSNVVYNPYVTVGAHINLESRTVDVFEGVCLWVVLSDVVSTTHGGATNDPD